MTRGNIVILSKVIDIQETGKGFSTLFLLEVLSAAIAECSTGESLDL